MVTTVGIIIRTAMKLTTAAPIIKYYFYKRLHRYTQKWHLCNRDAILNIITKIICYDTVLAADAGFGPLLITIVTCEPLFILSPAFASL